MLETFDVNTLITTHFIQTSDVNTLITNPRREKYDKKCAQVKDNILIINLKKKHSIYPLFYVIRILVLESRD